MVLPNDPKYRSGELVHIATRWVQANINGIKTKVSINDPRLLTKEIEFIPSPK